MKSSTITTIIKAFIAACAAVMLCSCGGKTDSAADFAGPGSASSDAAETSEAASVIQVQDVYSETTVPETTVPETPDYRAMVTGTRYAMDKVNVRTSPGTDGTVIGKLEPDEEVALIKDVSPEWTEILYQDAPAYAATRYLTEDKEWRKNLLSKNGFGDGAEVLLDPSWRYADYSAIHTGAAVMYLAKTDRKGIVIGVNAGHGTKGGSGVKTWCHPDQTPKITGGSTAAGAMKATAVSEGMSFNNGVPERSVTLQTARYLRDILLNRGYDVLMIRDGDDVQLDNIARTVICNNAANCHIALHWDGDGLSYDKGCFYMSVPDGLKYLDTVASTWEESERLGKSLINGLQGRQLKIFSGGSMDMDLTQTSYSTVPSVDIELGNQCSDTGESALMERAQGLADGIDIFFGQ